MIKICATLLLVCLLSPATSKTPPADITGTWQGTLEAPDGSKLRLVLHIAKAEKGGYSATLDSPDQNAMGVPVSEVKYVDGRLSLDISTGATYDGKLSADGKQIAGTFTQGRDFPLIFNRVEHTRAAREAIGAEATVSRRLDEERRIGADSERGDWVVTVAREEGTLTW